MIAATVGAWLILSQSSLGHHPHRKPALNRCETCGVATPEVLEQITRLQQCPKRRDRDRAAHVLRNYDWRCHPDVVGALAYSLLHDPDEEVREEAAQSLTKMAPCTSVAHMALSQAAESDPDHSTRRWARKALRALTKRCPSGCELCGPAVVESAPPLLEGQEPPLDATPPVPSSKVLPPFKASVVPPPPPNHEADRPLDDNEEIPALEPPRLAPIPSETSIRPRNTGPANPRATMRNRPRVAPFLFGLPARLADR